MDAGWCSTKCKWDKAMNVEGCNHAQSTVPLLQGNLSCCFWKPLSLSHALFRNGRSPSGRGVSVHYHSRGDRPAAVPSGPETGLSVRSPLLEETRHTAEGKHALHVLTALYVTWSAICSAFNFLYVMYFIW